MSSRSTRARSKNPLVFFDLETTGLIKSDEPLPDIIQIAAIYRDDIFDRYILPDKAMTPGAQEVTGMCVKGDSLQRDGKRLPTVRLRDAMRDFLYWLAEVSEDPGKKPILLAYNGYKYDVPILQDAFGKCGLESKAEKAVAGYADPLKMARDLIPRDEVDDYRLVTLVKKYCQITHDAHNAVGDSKALKKLYYSAELWRAGLSSYIFQP